MGYGAGNFETTFDNIRMSISGHKEEIFMVLEEWLNMESSFGCLGDVSLVQKKMPKKLKRKRGIMSKDGTPDGYAILAHWQILIF